MKTTFRFFQKHWLTIGLLIGSLVLVRWVVSSQRPPGSMSVIEAQAMDMASMKPPPGVFPVSVEKPRRMSVGAVQTFPGEVLAFADEDVVARLPGLVDKVFVYPGDRVRRGQLLATIKADEYGSLASESQLMAGSKSALAMAARHEVDVARQMIGRADAGVASAQASLRKAQSDLEAMNAERDRAALDAGTSQADLDQAKAESRYADQEFARDERLYKAGAIALDEWQSSQRDRDAKQAAVRSAESKLSGSKKGVEVAAKRASVAEAAGKEAQAAISAARTDRTAAEASLRRAQEQARAAQNEAASARASSSGSSTMAGYRELRALSDGEIAERVVSPGTAVSMGQTILKLKALDRVRVQAEIPQNLSPMVPIGTPVEIEADDLLKSAAITSVFPTVSGESRTFRVEAVLDNESRLFKSGMFVRMRLRFDPQAHGGSLAVRTGAILTDLEGKHFVWVVSKRSAAELASDWTCAMHPEVSETGPGKCPICKMPLSERKGAAKFSARKRPVAIGRSDGEFTAVVSGLRDDDDVIWAGHDDLFPEAPVQPTTEHALGDVGPAAEKGSGSAESNRSMPGMDMSGRRK